MSTPGTLVLETLPRPSLLNRLACRAVTRQLAGLRRGSITLEDAAGSIQLGQPADLHATIRVNDSRFFRDAVAGGTLSIAESYLRGDWNCDDLTSLFRIFVRNLNTTDRLDAGFARLAGVAHRLFHWCRGNTRAGSRRNIGAHYDLGNPFFRL